MLNLSRNFTCLCSYLCIIIKILVINLNLDWSHENAATSKEKSGNEISEDDNICLTPSMDTPTKVRKRFGMSFLDRTG